MTQPFPGYQSGPIQPEPTKKKSKVGIIIGLVILTLMGFAITSFFVYAAIQDDPGIAACKAMRDGINKNKENSQPEKKTTAEEYKKIRNLFSSSRYDDIKIPGVKLVDLSRQASQASDGGSFVIGLQVLSVYSDLSTGCANHEVELPPLM